MIKNSIFLIGNTIFNIPGQERVMKRNPGIKAELQWLLK